MNQLNNALVNQRLETTALRKSGEGRQRVQKRRLKEKRTEIVSALVE